MRDFGKLDPEQLHSLMLFALAAWMLGRTVVRPFVPPQTMTAMGMGGLLMALALFGMGEMLRRS